MKLTITLVVTIALSQIVYAEESSSYGGLSESIFSEESSLYYNAKDYGIREDYFSLLNSELDRLSNLISGLKKDEDEVFENEIGRAPIQQLENDDLFEDNEEDDDEIINSNKNDDFSDLDKANNKVDNEAFSQGTKKNPVDDELNDLDNILDTIVLSVDELLNILLHPLIGDKSTGRSGLLQNLVDKLGRVLNHVDILIDPDVSKQPREPSFPREDSDAESVLELDFEQNKQANVK